jgi:hypothetical protein
MGSSGTLKHSITCTELKKRSREPVVRANQAAVVSNLACNTIAGFGIITLAGARIRNPIGGEISEIANFASDELEERKPI